MTTINENQVNSAMTIRRMDVTDADQAALARLAELDSRHALQGAVLGAEVEGKLLAAISLETGDVIADPFSRTSELRAVLKLRASQIERRHAARRSPRSRIFGRRTRPALGGAPAGQIVTLQRGL